MKRLTPLIAGAALVATAFIASPARAQQTTPFENCPAAYDAGRANIPEGDPAYHPRLDSDGDGVGCENPPWGDGPAPTTATTTAPTEEPPAKAPATTRRPAPPTTAKRAPGAVKATPAYTG